MRCPPPPPCVHLCLELIFKYNGNYFSGKVYLQGWSCLRTLSGFLVGSSFGWRLEARFASINSEFGKPPLKAKAIYYRSQKCKFDILKHWFFLGCSLVTKVSLINKTLFTWALYVHILTFLNVLCSKWHWFEPASDIKWNLLSSMQQGKWKGRKIQNFS